MNVFQSAINASFDRLACLAGVEVTYHRGDSWVRLTAVPGQSDFQTSDGYGAVIESRSRDYIVRSCDLELGNQIITPKRGDQIKERVGDELHVHEVLRPDGGEQVYRYSDQGRSVVRVHTQLKARVAE